MIIWRIYTINRISEFGWNFEGKRLREMAKCNSQHIIYISSYKISYYYAYFKFPTYARVKWDYGNHIATYCRHRVKNDFKLPHNIIFCFRISLCTWTHLIRFHCNCVYTTAASYLIFTKFDCKDVKALTGQQILAHCPKYKALAYLIEMNDFLDI